MNEKLVDTLLNLHETAYDETVLEYVKIHEINDRELFVAFSANLSGLLKVNKLIENQSAGVYKTSSEAEISDYRLEFFL